MNSYPYLDIKRPDDSGITLEQHSDLKSIPYLDEKNSIIMHQHKFYELVLVTRGCTRHSYKGTVIPLIPGDLFLVPPEQPHAYQFQENITMYNCQFFPEVLEQLSASFISELSYTALQEQNLSRKRLTDLQAFQQEDGEVIYRHSGDINSQGILHLDRDALTFIQQILEYMMKEQEEQSFGFRRIKQLMLQQLLIVIKRVQVGQFESRSEQQVSWKDEMVDSVLNRIEENVAQSIDFNQLAADWNITPTYFRTIFKNTTGLSPVGYLNRVRILQAMELLQSTDMSVNEAAEHVGIYDANYFTRLFKKLIGYPPSYFRGQFL